MKITKRNGVPTKSSLFALADKHELRVNADITSYNGTSGGMVITMAFSDREGSNFKAGLIVKELQEAGFTVQFSPANRERLLNGLIKVMP
jgi:hypothetical protein